MPTLDRVSILVVSWNGRDHLAECLDSLETQRCRGARVEIHLFDNGSTDGTAEMVRRRHPSVQVLESPVNLGFASANNRLAETAAGDAIVLINNDMRAEPGWLDALADVYRSAPQDVSGVAGRIVDWSGETLDFGRGIMTFDGHAFALHQGRALDAADLPASGEETLFACGGNCLLRRQSFVEAGGFDERYFAYFEDVDLGWRLWAGGERLLHAADAVARHRQSATSVRLGNRRRGAMFERNALWTMLRNLEPGLREQLLPAILTTYLSRVDALVGEDDQEGLLTAPLEPGQAERTAQTRLARWLGRRRAGRVAGAEGVLVRSDAALAQLEALRAVFASLGDVEAERLRLAARRRRSDRDIFERFPLWIVPTYGGDRRLFASEFFRDLLPRDLRFERAELGEVLGPGRTEPASAAPRRASDS